ncbi:MAG: hypothetical protein Q7S04_01170 [Candidatus Moranbacteria bacterium]|nr:hypothetical protein [Candidatus Moranbacteria bacterium]
MNKFGWILVLALLACPAIAGETSFWIEPQVVYNKEKSLSRIDAGLSGNIAESIGYFAFGQALSNGYSQLYGGPNWKPLSWLEVGVGVGAESVKPSLRRSAYFLATEGKVSALGIYENGGSGRFRKLVATYQITESLKLGVMSETYLGFGPRVEYAVTKSISLWGAVLRDHESQTTNAVFATTINF